MVSIAISIILAALSLATVAPIVFPVFGLALGANAIIRERNQAHKRKSILIVAIGAIIMNMIMILRFALR